MLQSQNMCEVEQKAHSNKSYVNGDQIIYNPDLWFFFSSYYFTQMLMLITMQDKDESLPPFYTMR